MAVNIRSAERRGQCLAVRWNDESVTEFPFIWLRDNDVAELHATTRERTFDLTRVPIDIEPSEIACETACVRLWWPDRDDCSVYAADWLFRHRPGIPRQDPATVRQQLWNAAQLDPLPRFSASDCRDNPATLAEALRTVKSKGLILFHGLEQTTEAAYEFANVIGFKRQTNFGVTFEVVNKPDPNNLAYTADALPLHIDLTNQELVPGYQFLHCIRNEATGGESIFADGYRICADFAAACPDYFETLKRISIPCRFHDETCDIRRHRPVISQAANGEFTQLVFNAHLADVPDMPIDDIIEFYEAYQALMKLARGSQYSIRFMLEPGEMVMFDNRRVMHGRGAFDPSSGVRHLCGYYIDRNEVDSRLRVLARGGE